MQPLSRSTPSSNQAHHPLSSRSQLRISAICHLSISLERDSICTPRNTLFSHHSSGSWERAKPPSNSPSNDPDLCCSLLSHYLEQPSCTDSEAQLEFQVFLLLSAPHSVQKPLERPCKHCRILPICHTQHKQAHPPSHVHPQLAFSGFPRCTPSSFEFYECTQIQIC